MFAVIVNTITILIGASVGLLLRKGLPESISDAMMKGLGLCTIVIGIQGMIEEENILVLILSTIIGIVIGEWLDVDGRINRAAESLTSRFTGKGEGAKIAQAFVTSCLIMNVGAMTIVGSLDAGLRGNFSMLYTKSLLDLISGIPMAAAMGVGVMGSALFTLVFQGGIVLLAEYIAPYLSETLIKELLHRQSDDSGHRPEHAGTYQIESAELPAGSAGCSISAEADAGAGALVSFFLYRNSTG